MRHAVTGALAAEVGRHSHRLNGDVIGSGLDKSAFSRG